MQTSRLFPRFGLPALVACFLALQGLPAAQQQPMPLEPANTPAPRAPLSQAGSPPPNQPMFRANVNTILIDVRAVDKDGDFVRDLKPEEFRIYEDDAEQTLATFSLIDLPTEPEPPPTVAGIRVEPDVATNARSVEGRLYVIVMDDKPNMLSTRPGGDGMPAVLTDESYRLRASTYRTLARNFIEEHLTFGDRAALITTSGRKDMAQEFTNNRQRLFTAIDKFEMGFGQETTYTDFGITPSGAGDQTGTQVIDTARSAMIGLRSLSSYLAQIPGRRKAIVFFSERMGETFSTNSVNLNLNTEEARDFRELIEATARANVSIYVVDPVGVPNGPGATGVFIDDAASGARLADSSTLDVFRRDGLMSLAESTGGFAVTGTNKFSEGFERIVEENSSYYLLGYSSTNQKNDGKFRRVRVEVTRPGVTVRTRSGYFGREVKPVRTTDNKNALPPALVEMLNSPLPVPGLTMNVGAVAYRGLKDSEVGVSVIVEARGGDLQFTDNQVRYNGGMEVVMMALDPDGKAKASERGSLSMNLSRSTHQAISQDGVRLLSKMTLKPGKYQLRVAAQDSILGQTRGTVLYDLDVPDFSKGPISLSNVALASAQASRMPTTGTDRHWQQAIGTLPTSKRTFSPGDELREYVELYVNDKKTAQVEITTTVRSEAGMRIFTKQQTVKAERGAQDKFTKHPVTTEISLKDFTPGQYVLSVEARAGGQDAFPATRQVPFTVK